MKAIRVPKERILDAASALHDDWVATEMCVPSYCHWNPAIRWLFWSRQDRALDLMGLRPDETVVEYGCGLGVALPSLSRLARRVLVLDVKTAAGRRMAEIYRLDNVTFFDGADDLASLDGKIEPGSVDCVTALDVLEHIEDLDPVVAMLRKWMSPRGRVVVSGPSESRAYKIGRRIAGFHRYYQHGDENVFHEMDVFEVRATFERGGFRVDRELWLPPRPLPRAFLLMRLVPR